MRKSSFGAGSSGRPSLSGVPLRVRQDSNTDQHGGRLSTQPKSKARSFGGAQGSSIGMVKSSSIRRESQMSFIPKTGRASSGIGVRGRTDVPKDPRPISDKKYMANSIRQLLAFLTETNYPHPVSQKLLTSPTSKDFFKIFAFIYSKFHPNYKMVAKMEDEVPRLLRMLAYPFTFSKTYMFSVGSPHTWPHLLAATVWMIDLIQMGGDFQQLGGLDAFIFGASNADEFDSTSDEQIGFEYYEKTYAAFMKGADTFEDYDEHFKITMNQKCLGDNLESLEEENQKLENELELVDQGEEMLHKMREKIAEILQDQQSTQDYLEKMEQYKQSINSDLQESEEAIKSLRSDLEFEKERQAEMQMVYHNQDLTPSDVTRLKTEQGRLRQQVEQVEKQVEDIETEHWKVQMDTSHINEKVEKEVNAYNKKAILLKLVPETAELAQGKDFRLKAGSNADIAANFESNIRPMLKMMKIQSTENSWKKNKEQFQLQCKLEKSEEQISEQTERLAQQQKDLANLEAEIASLREMFHSDKKCASSELESVQNVLTQNNAERTILDKAKADAEKEYRDSVKLLDARRQAMSKILAEREEQRKKMQESVKQFKEKVENEMAGYSSRLKAHLDVKKQRIARFKQETAQRNKRIQQSLATLEDSD